VSEARFGGRDQEDDLVLELGLLVEKRFVLRLLGCNLPSPAFSVYTYTFHYTGTCVQYSRTCFHYLSTSSLYVHTFSR